MNKFTTVDTFENIDFSKKGTVYVEDIKVQVDIFMDQIRFTDVEYALKSGKTCRRVSISTNNHFDGWGKIFEFIDSISDIRDFISSDETEYGNDIKVYRYEHKSVNFFSPFNLTNLKPLKEVPKKWTTKHVVRMLANGQFEDLRRDSRYTDDYASDAAYNYYKGSINDVSAFMIRLLDGANHGWWIGSNGGSAGRISINCHHFEYNSVKPVII